MGAILEVTRLCFTDALVLRGLSREDFSHADSVRRQVAADVAAMVRDAREQGIAAGPTDLLKYAMIALLDEFAQAGPLGAYWTEHQLQAELLGDVNAGQGFFGHLETLLATRNSDETTLDILEVYASCLFFGFRGKYAARVDATGFDALRTRVEERLRARLTLEPPPSLARLRRTASPPLPRWIWLVVGVVLLFVASMWVSYKLALGAHATRLSEYLGHIQP